MLNIRISRFVFHQDPARSASPNPGPVARHSCRPHRSSCLPRPPRRMPSPSALCGMLNPMDGSLHRIAVKSEQYGAFLRLTLRGPDLIDSKESALQQKRNRQARLDSSGLPFGSRRGGSCLANCLQNRKVFRADCLCGRWESTLPERYFVPPALCATRATGSRHFGESLTLRSKSRVSIRIWPSMFFPNRRRHRPNSCRSWYVRLLSRCRSTTGAHEALDAARTWPAPPPA